MQRNASWNEMNGLPVPTACVGSIGLTSVLGEMSDMESEDWRPNCSAWLVSADPAKTLPSQCGVSLLRM